MPSLLSYTELLALVARGVITNVELDWINSASIDITLGDKLLVEKKKGTFNETVFLGARDSLKMEEIQLPDDKFFCLSPGEFILAQSAQVFNLPDDISCEFKLKSSGARIGLNHCLAGWCDAGWNGSVLTLELMNVTRNHDIYIKKGDKIGQMIFFHHTKVPEDRSYAARGRYNNDKKVTGAK